MHGLALAATPGTLPIESIPGGTDADRQLAQQCAAGDTGAFEKIFRTYGSRMKSIAFNHLGNTSDAEDAVQETFLKIHRAASSYAGEAAFSTWLYRILVNTCLDILRKRSRRPVEDALDGVFERAADSVDDTKRITLRKLVGALPEQKRSVFTLFEIEGLSHSEISQILGISEANSKWILFTTKKQLQEQWKQPR
jgi:RNA polymerase sigma-70 factor (ECF subfamily)